MTFYIYIFDLSTPSRITVKVTKDFGSVFLSNKIIHSILKSLDLNPDECEWMISNSPVREEEAKPIILVPFKEDDNK